MKYIIVDLEMNPIEKKYRSERRIVNQEVIEIGAVALNEQFEEIDRFKTYVKPIYNNVIKKNIERLTGISTSMVWSHPTFNQAIKNFFSWCSQFDDEIQFCEWSDSDLWQVLREMILKQYRPSDNEIKYLLEWKDVQKMYDTAFEKERCTALSEAIMWLDLDTKGKLHDALFDAAYTAEVLKKLQNETEIEVLKARMKEYCSPSTEGFTIGDLFDFSQLMAATA